jgi:hypothetical protein
MVHTKPRNLYAYQELLLDLFEQKQIKHYSS